MANSDQCAVAEDGSLLDASKIMFYNDPNDNNPLPNLVPESHHSGHVTQPSAHITDPNNLEASASVSCK